jgi:hypothetical protein
MEKDSPLQDLESILKEKSDQRQNEISEFFKEEKGISNVNDSKVTDMKSFHPASLNTIQNTIQTPNQMTSPLNTFAGPSLTPIASAPVSRNELEVHRRILENILVSQIKIIELLQRK